MCSTRTLDSGTLALGEGQKKIQFWFCHNKHGWNIQGIHAD